MLICANWKMNLNQEESLTLFKEFLKVKTANEIVVFPTSLSIYSLSDELKKANQKNIKLGIQNFYPSEAGAFTGEITISELPENIDYCLIGHSERRTILNESDYFVEEKINFALEKSKKVILCVGESIEVRKIGKAQEFILNQLNSALKSVKSLDNIIIAYEPIWSIGTGLVPTKTEVTEIINVIYEKFPTQILYGGSVTDQNISQFKDIEKLSGFLVGGASLNLEKFEKIVSMLN